MAALYGWVARQSLNAGWFSIDDPAQLYLIRSFTHWTDLFGKDAFGFFRPVKNLLFVLFDRLSGDGLRPARLLATGLGAATAAAVFLFFRRFLDRWEWALTAMAIWLLAPTMVSGIAWLSAVNITVMTGSLAGAFVCREHALECPRYTRALPAAVLSLAGFSFGLAAYEGAIVFWPTLILMDVIVHPSRIARNRPAENRGRVALSHGLYGLITLSYGIVYMIHGRNPERLGFFHATSRGEAMLASGHFVADHLRTWFWPFGRQAICGGYLAGMLPMARILAGWGLVAVLTLAVLGLRKRAPTAAFGIAWFLVTFAPMSNILGFRNGPYGDYYLILPSLGLALLLTIAAGRLLQHGCGRRWGRRAAPGLAAVLLATRLAAIHEAAVWSAAWNHPDDLWAITVQTFPHAFGAIIERAKTRVAAGDYDEADRLAQQALSFAPGTPQALAVLALTADRRNDTETALMLVREYLAVRPDCSWGLYFKGFLYDERLDRPDTAVGLYTRVVESRPWNADAVKAARALAYLFAADGRRPEAIDLWQASLQYDPADYATHLNLAIAYRLEGDPERSRRHAARGHALRAEAERAGARRP